MQRHVVGFQGERVDELDAIGEPDRDRGVLFFGERGEEPVEVAGAGADAVAFAGEGESGDEDDVQGLGVGGGHAQGGFGHVMGARDEGGGGGPGDGFDLGGVGDDAGAVDLPAAAFEGVGEVGGVDLVAVAGGDQDGAGADVFQQGVSGEGFGESVRGFFAFSGGDVGAGGGCGLAQALFFRLDGQRFAHCARRGLGSP